MIERRLHFFFGLSPSFGGKPFSLVHYLSAKSARLCNPDYEATLYYVYEPSGEWWEKVKHLLRVERVSPIREVFGQELLHPAHMTDVLRLEKLLSSGGVALDLDVICLKSFDELLEFECVLARERPHGSDDLCNAVSLARSGAPFLKRWLEGYDPARSLWSGFRSKGFDEYWAEMSVQYPGFLSRLHPDQCTIMPHASFFPVQCSKEGIESFFSSRGSEGVDLTESFAIHLWETLTWDSYLRNLNLNTIKHAESQFARVLRPLIEDI